jgi:hydrogenase expression/formation protein HypE
MSTDPLPVGKLPAWLLADLLEAVPARDGSVRLGPAVGEDAAAIDVPDGTLVVATDPITLTSSDAGRYAVIINANDVAVTGAVPRWFLMAMLLPVGTEAGHVRALFAEVTAALDEIDATLVGGHTEVTPAVNQPVLVGQMLGLVTADRLISTGGATPGDVLVQVGPVPVEGAAVLAAGRRDRLRDIDPALLDAAAAAADRPGISVAAAARLAATMDATAMHDPTEGGLATGLHELADASGIALRLIGEAVDWFAPGLAVCRELGADPWATLASGCLLATFAPQRVDTALAALRQAGHPAVRLGDVVAGTGVLVDDVALPAPERDEVARLLQE